jgi:hypothetical protein
MPAPVRAGQGDQMTSKCRTWSATLIALLSVLFINRAALAAQNEVECNNPAVDAGGNVVLDVNGNPVAKPLVFDGSGVAEVNGAIVNGVGYNPCAVPGGRDTDFYTFHANAGQTFSIAVLNAYEATGTWIDLAVFGPSGGEPYHMYRETFFNLGTVGPGQSAYDPAIPDFAAQETGTYYIGISSYPGQFLAIDSLASLNVTYPQSPPAGTPGGGTYTLQVTGAAPAVQQINIDIRPGRRNVIWAASALQEYSGRGHDSDRDHDLGGLRRHFRHGLPVALLSSDTFDAMGVDQSSLKFGSTGEEDSLIRCSGRGVDVNRDKRPDLVCWFDFTKAGFVPGDNEGVVTGSSNAGGAFEGKGVLKMVTGMPRFHRHDHDRDRDHDRDHDHRHHHHHHR